MVFKRGLYAQTTSIAVLWWLSKLRIQCCHCYGLGHCCVTAVGLTLAWEPLHAMGTAKKKKKKRKKKKQENKGYIFLK